MSRIGTLPQNIHPNTLPFFYIIMLKYSIRYKWGRFSDWLVSSKVVDACRKEQEDKQEENQDEKQENSKNDQNPQETSNDQHPPQQSGDNNSPQGTNDKGTRENV